MKKLYAHFKVIMMYKDFKINKPLLEELYEEGEEIGIKVKESSNDVYDVYIEDDKPVGRIVFEIGEVPPKGYEDYEIASKSDIKKIIVKNYEAKIVERKSLLYTVIIEEAESPKELKDSSRKTGLEEEKNRVLAFVEKEELEKRISYMKDLNFEDELIAEVLSLYENDLEVVEPKTLYNEKKIQDDDYLIKNMIEDILDGHNILLEGPKSTGKNVAWETVAWLLNMKICVQKISTQTTNDDVLGSMSTDNAVGESINEKGVESMIKDLSLMLKGECSPSSDTIKFILDKVKMEGTHLKFNPGILTKVLTRGRGLFIFDEMDMGTANFLSSIVNTLGDDHSQVFDVPGFGEVPIPKNVIFGATQNGSEYIGTQPQNDATMSRFTKYILANPASIKAILKDGSKANVNNQVYSQLDKVYAALREEVNEGTISDTCLNIRGFKRALDNIARGKAITKALERNVANICDADERETILSVIEAAL